MEKILRYSIIIVVLCIPLLVLYIQTPDEGIKTDLIVPDICISTIAA